MVRTLLGIAFFFAGAGCVKSEGTGADSGTAGSTGGSASPAGTGGSSPSTGGSASGTSGNAGISGGGNGGSAANGGNDGNGGNGGATGIGGSTGATPGRGGASGSGGVPAGGGSGGGGGSTGAGGTSTTSALTLSNLKIDPNPRMTLSCYVSWTTSAAASSEVQFGVSGYQFHIVDSAPVTSHKVHVVGMHAETAYQIKAISTNAGATGNATGTFTTGKLPTGTPKATVVTKTTDKIQPGWTLTNAFLGGTMPAIIVMVDADGLPIWYFVHGKSADQFGMTSVEWLPNGHVLIGNASAEPAREVDLEANIVWEGPTGGTPAASHHTGKTSAGNYLVIRESNTTARVEELSASNQIVWTWDLYSSLKPKTTAADWCHLNSVTVDVAKNVLYFNCRYQGLFKVNRADKSILWQMGAAIDDAHTGDVTYLPDNNARFNDSHDPEIHDDGTILFYDNQGWTGHTGGEMNGSLHTQVVEYMVDDTKKQATLAWKFPGTFNTDAWYKQSWATPIWGDANRLTNGNVLVTAGNKTGATRHFEVTRAGEVVWAIDWTNVGSYRGVRLAPVATPLP